MIALGLGEHTWSVDRCIEKYQTLAETCFNAKFLTKIWAIGWFTRLFQDSIYNSSTLENALKVAFREHWQMFSIKVLDTPIAVKHLPKVAITTTID
jgi:hypothetical protein